MMELGNEKENFEAGKFRQRCSVKICLFVRLEIFYFQEFGKQFTEKHLPWKFVYRKSKLSALPEDKLSSFNLGTQIRLLLSVFEVANNVTSKRRNLQAFGSSSFFCHRSFSEIPLGKYFIDFEIYSKTINCQAINFAPRTTIFQYSSYFSFIYFCFLWLHRHSSTINNSCLQTPGLLFLSIDKGRNFLFYRSEKKPRCLYEIRE